MKNAWTHSIGAWTIVALMSACSATSEQPPEPTGNETAAWERNSTEDLAGAQETTFPIRIGDSGPRFPACGSVGQVRVGDDDALEVQVAPFESSRTTDTLANGHRLFICMNSMDHKWLGVVYADDGQAPADCGVEAPVRSAREYAGPCKSGWVSSAFVRIGVG